MTNGCASVVCDGLGVDLQADPDSFSDDAEIANTPVLLIGAPHAECTEVGRVTLVALDVCLDLIELQETDDPLSDYLQCLYPQAEGRPPGVWCTS